MARTGGWSLIAVREMIASFGQPPLTEYFTG
jgi:hypothetical protein